ncbi:MAG TPA: hypothetical protein VLW06_04985 [Terriglobales bacterium]|nr:hypothetical protein [Terriglobales bacterium]
MKTLAHFHKRDDSSFHMPPSSAMFSLAASFVFALIVMLVLLAISTR